MDKMYRMLMPDSTFCNSENILGIILGVQGQLKPGEQSEPLTRVPLGSNFTSSPMMKVTAVPLVFIIKAILLHLNTYYGYYDFWHHCDSKLNEIQTELVTT